MLNLRRAARVLPVAVMMAGMLCWQALAQAGRSLPQYVGLPRIEVERRLIKNGFAAQWRSAGVAPTPRDQGRIAAQVPPAGQPLPSGAPVLLFVYDNLPAPGDAPASVQATPPPGMPPAATPRPANNPSAPAVPPAPTAPPPDCSKWAGSTYDRAVGACRCSSGQWWSLHGDRCVARERAAGEVCASKWNGSVPAFTGEGGFHCTCPPDRPWNAETMECSAASQEAQAECRSRWAGTVPVMSPSGTDYECRCPMGMRWEESRARCDASAMAVGGGEAVPAAADVPPEDEDWDEGEPGTLDDPASEEPPPQDFENSDEMPWPPPRAYDGTGPGRVGPTPRDSGAPPSRDYDSGEGVAPSRDFDADAPRPDAEEDGACSALLAEIRGRAGAGQAAEADALALRAATQGCDPRAISDAVAGGR